jgi:hypothetical protein
MKLKLIFTERIAGGIKKIRCPLYSSVLRLLPPGK